MGMEYHGLAQGSSDPCARRLREGRRAFDVLAAMGFVLGAAVLVAAILIGVAEPMKPHQATVLVVDGSRAARVRCVHGTWWSVVPAGMPLRSGHLLLVKRDALEGALIVGDCGQ